MSDTTHPLTPQEFRQLFAALPSYHRSEKEFRDVDPVRLVLWTIGTGMHPFTLATPIAHKIEIVTLEDGFKYVTWDRPKKKGVEAGTVVPLLHGLEDWGPAFIDHCKAHPVTTRTLRRAVASVGRHAGLHLSPRTLRHQFLRWVADRTHDPSEVEKLGNVSPPVAIGYVRQASAPESRRKLLGLPSPGGAP